MTEKISDPAPPFNPYFALIVGGICILAAIYITASGEGKAAKE